MQAKNAMDRLRPYVTDQKPLGVGAGGPAGFQDVMRILFAQRVDSYHPERAAKMKQGQLLGNMSVFMITAALIQDSAACTAS